MTSLALCHGVTHDVLCSFAADLQHFLLALLFCGKFCLSKNFYSESPGTVNLRFYIGEMFQFYTLAAYEAPDDNAARKSTHVVHAL